MLSVAGVCNLRSFAGAPRRVYARGTGCFDRDAEND
jgi:hypothetical protein